MRPAKLIQKNEGNYTPERRHWVRTTRLCNNNCIFCLDKENQNGDCLLIAQIEKDLIAGRERNIDRVILSGGEATLHPRLIDIIKSAKNLGYRHVQIITNGRMFAYKNFLDSAIKAGVNEITFSMHGHNKDLHDRQTRVKGSFDESLSGLKNALCIKGLVVNVDIVINKLNIVYLKEIMEFFINLGITEFDLLQIVPFGNAWDNREELFYDPEDYRDYLAWAFQLIDNKNLRIWTNRFPAKYLEGFEALIQHPDKLFDEVQGRKDMFERFINGRERLSCFGRRCRYCFLGMFCEDLARLKQERSLIAKKIPLCLRDSRSVNTVKSNKRFHYAHNFDIFKFLDFYINYRYFIKSPRCKYCRFDKDCEGMQCGYLRKNGLKNLKPHLTLGVERKLNVFEDELSFRIVRLDSHCNCRCLFCNVPEESGSFKEMSTQEVKTEISRLLRKDKKTSLDFSGGEPTLRKDLPELISYSKRKGIKIIQIQTNAILLSDKRYAERLKAAGLTNAFVSFHSHDKKVNDLLMDKSGVYEKCIQGIKNLLALDIRVILNIVITSLNYKDFPEYIKFLLKELPEVKDLNPSVVQPRGRVLQNRNLVPRYQKIDPYLRKGLCLARNNGISIRNASCGLPLCIGGWQDYLEECVEYYENFLRLVIGTKYPNLGKVKGECCLKCDLNEFCNGIWKEYAEIYSFSDLKPVTLNKR